MRRREQELIAALAEGRLENEAEARGLVASSPRLQDEYQAQKAAIQTLRELGSASLTEIERASLRRDLWTELRAEESKASPQSRRLTGWPAYATALALVVGSLAVLGPQLSQTDMASAPTFEETAAGLGDDGAQADEADAASQLPSGSDVTQEAALEGLLVPDDLLAYRALADAIRLGDTDAYSNVSSAMYSARDARGCLSFAGLETHHFLGQFELRQGTATVAASPVENPTDETPITFIDPETCEITFVVD